MYIYSCSLYRHIVDKRKDNKLERNNSNNTNKTFHKVLRKQMLLLH